MTSQPKPARQLPRVKAPTTKQALRAGAAALLAQQRRYAPEAMMFEHGIAVTPYHARAYLRYYSLSEQRAVLLALARKEPT